MRILRVDLWRDRGIVSHLIAQSPSCWVPSDLIDADCMSKPTNSDLSRPNIATNLPKCHLWPIDHPIIMGDRLSGEAQI